MTYKVIDLFAGPGGWEVGASYLGLNTDDILGIEWDAKACETARAAGFHRFQADVSLVGPTGAANLNVIEGLIASPPCQAWSAAGKKLGLLDQQRIFDHLDAVQRAGEWIDYTSEDWNDIRSPLVLEPLRWALELNPLWLAFEQVPAVLPYWERLGDVLRSFGWSISTGNLQAEQYGVPQTRKRAILVGSRDHEVAWPALPSPIMQSYRKGRSDDLSGLPQWVSMATALGWGLEDRPSWTVSGGGTATGGAEVFANAANRRLLHEVVMRSNYGTNGNAANRGTRDLAEPAPAVTSKINRNMWQARDSGPGATRDPRPIDKPSYTVRANGSGSNPSGVRWVGDDEPVRSRVTINEAAVLQSFPPNYPWQGGKGAQYRQVGDAIPPLLAAAVLGQLLGIDWHPICTSHYLTCSPEHGKFSA